MDFALNEKGLKVYAEDATKEEKYFCPCCGEEVVLKDGKVNITHLPICRVQIVLMNGDMICHGVIGLCKISSGQNTEKWLFAETERYIGRIY